ncbi:DUF1493 family protein [Flavobacterium sp. Sd200]|uniref:DUF1493 family protein n=1 Tax=Flavobacterium sp. Sd200 TaxID=2692211 RepID=UPI00136D6F6D|nr:DUF1493 family protein [Flavobacterium sp. Sd200]MXN91626.1 DUF1493 family protein [Flavobacterium sp. Sd200]
MERQSFTADYVTLKSAYLEVKTFLEKESFDKVDNLSTKIENDLGMAGDDNYELLEKFVKKYDLGHHDFDYSKHFLSEGELFSPFTTLYYILISPFWFIKIISYGKINLLPPKGYWQRETLDLTFGDMVAWYLHKNFKLRSEINIKLST